MNRDQLPVIHSFPVWLPQTQTWMFNQVKYLPETVEVHVVCESTENLEQFGMPNVHSLKDISELRFYWEKALRKMLIRNRQSFLAALIKETSAQVIHSHFGNIGWANLKAVQSSMAKHVVTYYGYDVGMLPTEDKRWVSRYHELFDQADLFLCEGPHMAMRLIQLGCAEEKVRVQHLGVETDLIPYKPRQWENGRTLRILLASTFHEKKGIPYALQAISQIQHMVPIEITIIGDATSQSRSQIEKQHILEILENSGLRPKTRLLGYQPYSVLFEEAYKHHLFLSPSVTASNGDTEGGAPVVLIEMIATGMPVISTLHCDIPGVIQYGIDDWLVKERDVVGLVEKLRWLIETPNGWDNMLSTGRAHVEKEFNSVQQGKRLGKIYHDLLNG